MKTEAVAARDVAVLVPVQLGEGLSEPRNLLGLRPAETP